MYSWNRPPLCPFRVLIAFCRLCKFRLSCLSGVRLAIRSSLPSVKPSHAEKELDEGKAPLYLSNADHTLPSQTRDQKLGEHIDEEQNYNGHDYCGHPRAEGRPEFTTCSYLLPHRDEIKKKSESSYRQYPIGKEPET